jgi:hypothetical protein
LTVSGKKSWPGFGSRIETTVASTVVSPYVATTAPSAWRAILPVSRTSFRPPHSISTFWWSNMAIPFVMGRAGQAMNKTAGRSG